MSSKSTKHKTNHHSGGTKQPARQQSAKQHAAKQQQPTTKPGRSKLLIGGIAAAILIGLIVAIAGNGSKGATNAGTPGTASAAPADEAKYLGRLLPASYAEPSIGKTTIYTSAASAQPVTATDGTDSLSIPLSDLTSKRIVLFNYTKADGTAIPVLAYLKPSGKVFVGVSFCPPCKGEGQRIEPDMTLTCETCGTKRQVETMIGVSGACKLYPLDEVPAKIANGKLVIEKAPLDSWTAQPLDRPIGG